MKKKIVGIVGSLRKDSYNKHLMVAVKLMAAEKADMDVEIVDIGNLPLFNQDLEAAFPKVAQDLKDKIKAADGIVIATPEYNRSIPGVLKNAIDWVSRPYGANAIAGKPVLVLGASGGPIATALAQYHLKQVLLYLDAKLSGQPEFFLGAAQDKFDKNGVLTDASTKDHILKSLQVFAGLMK